MAEGGAPAGSPFRLREVCEFPSRTFASARRDSTKTAAFACGSEESILVVVVRAEADDEPDTHLVPWQPPAPRALCFDPSASTLACCATAEDSDEAAPTFVLRLISVAGFVSGRASGSGRDVREVREVPLPLEAGKVPTAIAWWQPGGRSQPALVVGDQTGQLLFLALAGSSVKLVGKSYIVGRVCELAVCRNGDDDSVDLLITTSKNRQWRLLLEEKTSKTNKAPNGDKKKTNLFGYTSKRIENMKKKVGEIDFSNFQIEKFVSDFVTGKPSGNEDKQSSNVLEKFSTYLKDNNPCPVYVVAAQENSSEVPESAKTRLLVSQQSGNGFISTLNSLNGKFCLYCSLDFHESVMTYKIEDLPSDVCKILWQKSLIYSFGTNSIKIHSSHLSLQQNENQHTVLWEDSLDEGEYLIDAYAINGHKKYPVYCKQWCDTQNVEELVLPRFDLGSCLIVTNKKVYLLKTSHDPCEWLVKKLLDGQSGVERMAAALEIRLPDLLLGTADILLAKKSFQRALSIYRLAKVPSDEIIMRLGASEMWSEMLSNELQPQSCSVANVYCIALILSAISDRQQLKFLLNFLHNDNVFDVLIYISTCADLGLWNAIETISFHKGMVELGFESLVCRLKSPCRGLLYTLLNKFYIPFIIMEFGLAFLKFIDQYCESFDILLLKRLCIWLCPLQDCFRIPFRALCTSQSNSHSSGMRRLMSTFFGVMSTLNSRICSKEDSLLLPDVKNTNPLLSAVTPQEVDVIGDVKTVISCGHTHWGIASEGKIKLMHTNGANDEIRIDVDLIGKALGVSCGREHSLILTENGVYSIGDNRFGQLGIGGGLSLSHDTPMLVGAIKKSRSDVVNKESFTWYNENVIQVAAGQYHSACVTDTGSLYTWGWGIHGQLAHGSIYNEYIPKRVAALKSEKVTFVGCGCCHTAILTSKGSVYVCGNSAFGQIGDSSRQKCNVPLLIDLGPNPVVIVAVGYFHTLALTANNDVWTWGSSPQKLRLGARNAKMCKMRSTMSAETQDDSCIQIPSPTMPEDDFHLYPTKVDISNVTGRITAMAGGWHHSSLVDHLGNIYVWGLNLDCQLGTGDRNEVFIPTSVDISQIKCDQLPEDASTSRPVYKEDSPSRNNKFYPNVSCGGDFTVHVTAKGDLFATGNSFLQETKTFKSELRVVMFKNTKRIIRFPKPHTNLQKTFKYMPLQSNFLQSISVSHVEIPFVWPDNPISSMESFNNSMWASSVLACLYQFVDDDTPLFDTHLRAALAIFRGDYAEAMNLQLNSLITDRQDISTKPYLQHGQINKEENLEMAKDLLKNKISNLSREWLSVPHADISLDEMSCLCDEHKYVFNLEPENKSTFDGEVTPRAISIVRSVFNILSETNCSNWADSINEATTFWIDHELNMDELENILMQNMTGKQAIHMASAIFCSKDKVNYQKHMSTALNLELCDKFLQSWS